MSSSAVRMLNADKKIVESAPVDDSDENRL